MTWQGGKRPTEVGSSVFARLKPLAEPNDDLVSGLDNLVLALSDFGRPVSLNIRLITDPQGEVVEHWEVHGGSADAKAQRAEPAEADVIVVMRPETWSKLALGELAPYEALYTGQLRVGGNMHLAKAIARHLSDPASPYVAPC